MRLCLGPKELIAFKGSGDDLYVALLRMRVILLPSKSHAAVGLWIMGEGQSRRQGLIAKLETLIVLLKPI